MTQAGATITHTYAYGSSVGYAATVKVTDNLGAVSTKAVRNVAITGSPWAQIGYVVNSTPGTVSGVNFANQATIASITVGNSPRTAAVSPDGSKVYVTNTADNSVSVFSTTTNAVTKTISVGTSPWGMTLTPDGTKVYVSNNGSRHGQRHLHRIDSVPEHGHRRQPARPACAPRRTAPRSTSPTTAPRR